MEIGLRNAAEVQKIAAKVLIVDDQRINRFVMARACQEEGVEVDESCSGEDALDRCRGCKYDLILMDYELPGIDGLTCSELIRKDKLSSSAEIIMVTANLEVGKVLPLAANVKKVIYKPFDTRELRNEIRVCTYRLTSAPLREVPPRRHA